MEDEQIKAVKNWPKPMSIKDIQVFIRFANFYQRFIWDFNRIASPLTSIFKATASSDLAQKTFKADDDEVVGVCGRAEETFNNLFKSKKSKNDKSEILTRSSDIRATREPMFLTLGAKEAFNQLGQHLSKLRSSDILI